MQIFMKLFSIKVKGLFLQISFRSCGVVAFWRSDHRPSGSFAKVETEFRVNLVLGLPGTNGSTVPRSLATFSDDSSLTALKRFTTEHKVPAHFIAKTPHDRGCRDSENSPAKG